MCTEPDDKRQECRYTRRMGDSVQDNCEIPVEDVWIIHHRRALKKQVLGTFWCKSMPRITHLNIWPRPSLCACEETEYKRGECSRAVATKFLTFYSVSARMDRRGQCVFIANDRQRTITTSLRVCGQSESATPPMLSDNSALRSLAAGRSGSVSED
jgi:hypothetical protein